MQIYILGVVLAYLLAAPYPLSPVCRVPEGIQMSHM